MYGLHLLEAAKGMTFRDELCDGSLMQGAGNQQDYVVNHVTVPKTGDNWF